MEYKEGDFVIGWDHDRLGYHKKPWKIVKINGNSLYATSKNWTYLKCVRSVTIEEVEQYVKDNNYTIDQILDVCKQLYPTNTRCITIYDHGSPWREETILSNTKLEVRHNNIVGGDTLGGFLYAKGKFARLVNSTQQEELPFKVGDKCYHKSFPESRYYITIQGSQVVIKKDSINGSSQGTWSISYFTEMVKEKTYIIVNKSQQFKKEDFYSTKIDVSESEELSRLVQEKLFELGFTWAGGQRHYLRYTDKYLRICNDNSIIASNSSSYKEIYPQDLGININNKKQTNNVNNKETISKENNGISKVQGFNQQISEPSRTRGIGLERTRSKISLGTINSPNKVGLSKC